MKTIKYPTFLLILIAMLISTIDVSANSQKATFTNPAQKAGKINASIKYKDNNGNKQTCTVTGIATHPIGTSPDVKADSLAKRISQQCSFVTATPVGGGVVQISSTNGGSLVKVKIDDKTNQKITQDPKEIPEDQTQSIHDVQGQGLFPGQAEIILEDLGILATTDVMGKPASQVVFELAEQLMFQLPPELQPLFQIFPVELDPFHTQLHILGPTPFMTITSDYGGDSGLDWTIEMGALELLPPLPPLPGEFLYPPTFPQLPFSPFVILPGVVDIFSITPPIMLNPTNDFVYGQDYFAFQVAPDVMGLHFERPGVYWVQYLNGDGTTGFDLFSYYPPMCGPDVCCEVNSGLREVDCGAPDLGVISDGVTIQSYASAETTDTVSTLAEAKQAICDKYDAEGGPISVGIKGHGSSGSITIGSEVLNSDNIDAFVQGIKGKISTLRLFSCSTGANAEFICELEQKLGCDVIASDDVMEHHRYTDGTEEWHTYGDMVSWNPKTKTTFVTPATESGKLGATIKGEKPDGTEHEVEVQGTATHPVGTPPEVKADSLAKRINEKILLDPFLKIKATAVGNFVIIETLDGDRLIRTEIYDATKQVIIANLDEMSGTFRSLEIPISGIGEFGIATVSFDDLGVSASADMTGRTAEEIATDLMLGLQPLLPLPPHMMMVSTEVIDPLNAILHIQSRENFGSVTSDFGGANGIGVDNFQGGFELIPPQLILPDPVTIPVEILSLQLSSSMPVLHDVATLHAIAPPIMLNPDHDFIYGQDYGAFQTDEDSYSFFFERPGIYLVDITDIYGESKHHIYEVDMRKCTDSEPCCEATSRAIEIPCGDPNDNDSIDLVIKSSTLNLGYDPDWDNARTEVEASTVQQAKQAICDAYAANGNQPITVAIDAHGNSGYFKIGNEYVDAKSLKNFVEGIKGKVSQLRLFSCKTGSDSKFICQLERMLCADVVSSTGSNWDTPPDKQDETGQHWYTDGELTSWEPTNEIAVDASVIMDAPVDPNTGFYVPGYYNDDVLPPLDPMPGFGFSPLYPYTPLLDSIFLLPDPGLPVLPVDWGFMELVDPSNDNQPVASRSVIINEEGKIVDTDGSPLITFDLDLMLPFSTDSLKVRLRSRTSVTELSGNFHVDSFFDIAYTIDFELRVGDGNFDNVIDAADRSGTWNFRNAVGYLPWDINYDGVVDAADRSTTWNNRNESGQ